MSIDLEGAMGELTLQPWDWLALQELAQRHGWQPQGTIMRPVKYVRPGLEHLLPDHLEWAHKQAKRRRRGQPVIGTDPMPPDGWIEIDEEPEWDGDYMASGGQYVTEEDATGLADALERALLAPAELDDARRGQVVKVIALCRAGGFTIR